MSEKDALLAACVQACDACAAECARSLAQDETYTSGFSRFTQDQLALVACESVCTLTARAIRNGDQRLGEVCAWCADVCDTCTSRERSARDWNAVVNRCSDCAARCRQVAVELLRGSQRE